MNTRVAAGEREHRSASSLQSGLAPYPWKSADALAGDYGLGPGWNRVTDNSPDCKIPLLRLLRAFRVSYLPNYTDRREESAVVPEGEMNRP